MTPSVAYATIRKGTGVDVAVIGITVGFGASAGSVVAAGAEQDANSTVTRPRIKRERRISSKCEVQPVCDRVHCLRNG